MHTTAEAAIHQIFFADSEIAAKDSYAVHLNKYNVIHIDVSSFWDAYKEM